MNKQGKNGIEWCDYTWSPVTGCLYGCEYCYARGIVKRFGGGGYGKEMGMFISKYKDDAFEPPYVLEEPQLVKTKDDWYRQAPYPFGFAPTFHRYRLNEPQRVKKPQNIFVVSMGELFGDWVPDEWIEEVFKACEAALWHKYLFLTKNPARYRAFYCNHNIWLGATVTDQNSYEKTILNIFSTNHRNLFLSIEPLLGEINFKTHTIWRHLKWVIIGQQTGPGAKPPKDEWVQNIISRCRVAGVPVFVKSPLFEKFPIQEWPEGLK